MMRASHGLAVHRDHPAFTHRTAPPDPSIQAPHQRHWIDPAEHPPEPMVRRNPVRQLETLAEPQLLRQPEHLDFFPRVRSADRRTRNDHDDVRQLVPASLPSSHIRQLLIVLQRPLQLPEPHVRHDLLFRGLSTSSENPPTRLSALDTAQLLWYPCIRLGRRTSTGWHPSTSSAPPDTMRPMSSRPSTCGINLPGG